MSHETPLVSVVIPTYNRSALVQLALDSVLAQTFTSLEIIVVDDGSTDGTGSALARYGRQICYIPQENQGESVARNHGIKCARGEYIAFLDSDDLWHPTKLARQLVSLRENPSVGLVFCQATKIDADGRVLPGPALGAESSDMPLTFENLCRRNLFAPSTVVMRRTLLDAVGGFDPAIQYGEDWDLWLRSVLVAQMQGIPEPLASIRLHRGGQWRFPRPDKVQRVLTDHLRLLNGAFARWPDRSPSAQTLRAQCLAREYGNAAIANYAWEESELATAQLQEAIQLDAAHWGDPQQLSQEIVNFAFLLGQSQPDEPESARRYVCKVLNHLPAPLSGLCARQKRLQARVDVELGYYFLACGDRQRARAHLTRGLWTDPSWLRNRGTVAELLKLWFGAGSITWVRRLARQLPL